MEPANLNWFHAAVVSEAEANEDLLVPENALDISLDGFKEKCSINSWKSVIQQFMLLSCLDEPIAEVDFLLEEAVTKITAIQSQQKPPATLEMQNLDNLADTVKSMISSDAVETIRKLDSYYEGILAPMDTVASENKRPPPQQETSSKGPRDFITASEMMGRQTTNHKKVNNPSNSNPSSSGASSMLSSVRKPVGLSKRIRSDPPSRATENEAPKPTPPKSDSDPRLNGIDPKLLETIQNEIIHQVESVSWDQIAGLEHAKNTIKEIVIWPMLRPDIFSGLRGPPKGLLLFGPPGTGKTMIGKCIASQAKATFFSISASSLTSKWVGEGEKLVRALFASARALQPSVIFIDEIDSLLTQRTDGEFEASRRIKTEFLVQFDGASTSSDDRILVIGATNRPQELDEAARRRLVKRLYIPLPDSLARRTIILSLLSNQQASLNDTDIGEICERTEGYSGADVDNLCREAALGPIRCIENIMEISPDQVRPINMEDFKNALSQVRASVSETDLSLYLEWNNKFGSLSK